MRESLLGGSSSPFELRGEKHIPGRPIRVLQRWRNIKFRVEELASVTH